MRAAKGSAGLRKCCDTLIFLLDNLHRLSDIRQASGMFFFNQWVPRAWEETHARCFHIWRMMQNSWHLPDIQRKTGEERILWKDLVNVQTPDLFFSFSSFQSEWSAAVLFIPNPALPVAVSFQKQSLFSVCFWYLEILIFFLFFSFFLIILSFFFLFFSTLPEKQSSSAVAWASPGCHVFLKGCLRGTRLQLEPFLITCSIRLSSFLFSLTSSSRRPQSLQWNTIYLITFFFLPYCRVMLLSHRYFSLQESVDFFTSSWNGCLDIAFEQPLLSFVLSVCVCVFFFL